MLYYISNDLLPVAMGYPAGWAVCCIVITTYKKFRNPGLVLLSVLPLSLQCAIVRWLLR